MTIKELMQKSNEEPQNFTIYFGNFLDEFYNADDSKKNIMIQDPPENYDNIKRETYAYVAAAVEKLCNDSKIQVPSWAMESKYFLEEPYFAMNAKGFLKVILLFESPNEFLVRNIFVSENVLDRV
ncbi:MAG: hypothetical protein AB2421_19345 [Thermotaleaceae bacterium]